LRYGIDLYDVDDGVTLLDLVETELVTMHADGTMRVLIPNADKDWRGWDALLATPPVVATELGAVELILNREAWGVDVEDEPPPAPLRDPPEAPA
jgi:hypothetical protein